MRSKSKPIHSNKEHSNIHCTDIAHNSTFWSKQSQHCILKEIKIDNQPAKRAHSQSTTQHQNKSAITYLKDPDKKKCHCPRKAHVNHGECYRKRKVEVLWRQNPLQNLSKRKSMILHWRCFN